MEVLNVKEKCSHSDKTGKDYYSYDFDLGYMSRVGEKEVFKSVKVHLRNNIDIQNMLQQKIISSYKDMIGHDIELGRRCPVWLSEYEKKYNTVQADCIISYK